MIHSVQVKEVPGNPMLHGDAARQEVAWFSYHGHRVTQALKNFRFSEMERGKCCLATVRRD